MAIVEIPTQNDLAAYSYEIELDGKMYMFEFMYIQRIKRWVFNIYNENKELLVAGLTLHTNANLRGRFTDPNLPPGLFVCLDTEGANKSAERDDLGVRVKLMYQETVESENV